MLDPSSIKALFFDVFGTVVDWRTSIARESQTILKPKGYALDWLAFADAWRDEYQPAMEEVRTGRHPVLQARRAAPAQSRAHPAALQGLGSRRGDAARTSTAPGTGSMPGRMRRLACSGCTGNS